jgi:acetyl esterase
VHRVAVLLLRGARVRVCWPDVADAGLVVLLRRGGSDLGEAAALCAETGAVVLTPDDPERDGWPALRWAADHADELDADPRRLAVAGDALATAAARRALEHGIAVDER